MLSTGPGTNEHWLIFIHHYCSGHQFQRAQKTPRIEFPVLKKRTIQLAGCHNIPLSPSGACKSLEGRIGVLFQCPCVLRSAGWGKSEAALPSKVSLQGSSTEAKPLRCTPPSHPPLYVVWANLHLSISESSAFSYSLCFPVNQRSQLARQNRALGKCGLPASPHVWSFGVFHFPPSTFMGGRKLGSNSDPAT